MKRNWGSQWDSKMMNFLMDRGPAALFNDTIPIASNRSCLVLGAGPEVAAIKKFAKSIVGINVDVNELRRIKAPDVDVIIGDAQKLPLKQSGFDIIICRSTLHHLKDLNGALAEMDRVLRDDSFIFLHEPGLFNVIAFIGRKFFPTNIHDPTELAFNPNYLRKAISEKFKIIKEADFFLLVHLFPIIGRRLKIFRNNILLSSLMDLDIFLSKTFLGNLCWIFVFLLKKKPSKSLNENNSNFKRNLSDCV
jgi:SAM-dependent methyltransferase